jgi:FSR family fosmidomycin resistance protein-like MFS transporter
MNKSEAVTLSGYSVIHGIIDLSCAAFVLASLYNYNFSSKELFILIVAYNVIAFGLQAPLGYLVDKFQAPKASAFIGSLLVLTSLFLFKIPALVVILSGLGNAFFHVGGGSISLNIDPKKATPPGIFVAPGALGLTIGTLIGKSGEFVAWPFILLLLLSCIFILFSKIPEIDYLKKPVKKEIKYFELVIILLLLSVSIRALYGLTAPWKAEVPLLMSLTVAIVAGKALGGVIADKLGWVKTAILALLISAPLLSFYQHSPVLAIIGVFLFQMTMPITVTALSNMLPGRSATAFGLTVLALIIGVLPTYFGAKSFLDNEWVTFSIIIISASSLLISFKFLYTYFKDKLRINF